MHILRTLFFVIHLLRRTGRNQGTFDVRLSRKVLLVMTTAVGDTLMCTPAIRSVRKSLPDARIWVLVDRRRLTLVKENPYIDELISYPGKFRRLWWIIGELRRVDPDVAIILHANDPDIVPLVYLSGAPVRVGWAESAFSFLLTHPVTRPKHTTHFIEHKGLILAAVGIPLDSKRMDLHVSQGDKAFVDQYLKEANIESHNILLALHPFASESFRWWPEDNVVRFLHAMNRHPEVVILLLGGKGEGESVEIILRRSKRNARPAVNGFTLGRLAALLERVKIFVGTDSGPMHIVEALGIPRIGLFGPQLPEVYGTESKDAIHIQAEVGCSRPCKVKSCAEPLCMHRIRPERVYAAVLRLLDLVGIPRMAG